ncbi:hypothetical protein ACFQXA_38295 [Nocardiopsis composta]
MSEPPAMALTVGASAAPPTSMASALSASCRSTAAAYSDHSIS